MPLKLGIALVAALIPCLAAEVTLRLLAGPPDTQGLFTELSSEIEYSGRPHARGFLGGVPVAFNEFGLRDREHTLAPAPGTIRILALGDSYTFGLGVPEELTYPRVTEALLNASRGDAVPAAEILNFGIPGYNTLHELEQLRQLGLAFHPGIVVVGFLFDDLALSAVQRRRLEATDPPGSTREPSGDGFGAALRSSISAGIVYMKQHSLLAAWAMPRLGVVLRPLGVMGVGSVGAYKYQFVESNPEWQRVRRALLEMNSLCEQHECRLVVVILPAMARFSESGYPIPEYHDAVSAFCRSADLSCLDLLPAFWGLDGTQLWISPTDGHPNAQADRIIADALSAFLAPMLTPHADVVRAPAPPR
jgi:lysophospholipase L1-like esterase